MTKIKHINNDKYLEGYYPLFIFIGAILLLFFKNLNNSLSYLDDETLFVNNAHLFQSINWYDVFNRDVFLADTSSFYRPFQTLIYYILFHLSNNNFSVYFLANIILHTATVIALFYLLIELKFSRKISFWSALLFSVNPLFVHAISWIPSMGDLIVGFSLICSFYYFLKTLNSNNKTYLIAHTVFFAIAMFTKESSILFPLILTFYYYYQKNKKELKKIFAIEAILWVAIIFIYLFSRFNVIVFDGAKDSFSIGNILGNLPVVSELMFKFFIPYNLSPLPRINYMFALIGLIIIAAIVLLLLKKNIHKDINVLLGGFWIILLIVPTLTFNHLLNEQSYQYLEHRAYLPFIGLILIISKLLEQYKILYNKNNITLLLVLSVLYGGYTFLYSSNYKNPEKFFGRALKINPNDPLAHYNRGVSRHKQKLINEALSDYNKALELKPDYNMVFNNRAIAYSLLQQPDLAIPDFTNAIRYNPNSSEYYTNRGNSYTMLNKLDSALMDYNTAIALNPQFGKAYLYRANVNFRLNRRNQACQDAEKSAQLGMKEAIEILNKHCR